MWSPPPAPDINGVIDNYLVEVTEVITNITYLFYATQTSVNVGPLHPYYDYRCRVSAVTIGPGPYTPFFLVTSGEAGNVFLKPVFMSTNATYYALLYFVPK